MASYEYNSIKLTNQDTAESKTITVPYSTTETTVAALNNFATAYAQAYGENYSVAKINWYPEAKPVQRFPVV